MEPSRQLPSPNRQPFNGAEEDFGDWDFPQTCFVGAMDPTQLSEMKAVAANPGTKRVPTDEAGVKRAHFTTS